MLTHVSARGGIVFGHFFGPRRSNQPSAEWLKSRVASQSVFRCRFRDRALYSGEWPTLLVLPGFNRAEWPLPAFHRYDGSVTATAGASAVVDWRVEYEDTNLVTPVKEIPASRLDMQLEDDTVYDPYSLIRAVEPRLSAAVPSADEGTWR
jgi:hypothetical protein